MAIGKSQKSKEAWLASQNVRIDHDDPWGRRDGLNGLGPAITPCKSGTADQIRGVRDGHGERAGCRSPVRDDGHARVRYLLRNGLDYLNYQQYERALKFLREAEKRDGEAEKRGKGELNKTEKLALKQGIERAQRGMRDAADAEVPYALSDRSRRRNGFIAAKSDPQVASNTNPGNGPTPPTHKASRLDQPTRLGQRKRRPRRTDPAWPAPIWFPASRSRSPAPAQVPPKQKPLSPTIARTKFDQRQRPSLRFNGCPPVHHCPI